MRGKLEKWLTMIDMRSPTLPSHSQRLRAVLFRVWQQSAARKAGMDQETFYARRMDEIIALERKALDPPEYGPMDQ